MICVAYTQAQSQVSYFSQGIPAVARSSDKWQVWGWVGVLLPMWMCIIIIIIVITIINIIMPDSLISSHWPACWNSCIECIIIPSLLWW